MFREEPGCELASDAGPPRHFFLSFLRFSIVTNYCTYILYLLTITKATTNIVKRCEDVPQKPRFSPNAGFAIRPSPPILMRWPWGNLLSREPLINYICLMVRSETCCRRLGGDIDVQAAHYKEAECARRQGVGSNQENRKAGRLVSDHRDLQGRRRWRWCGTAHDHRRRRRRYQRYD